MGKNVKKHNKVVFKKVIVYKGNEFPEENFQLVQCYNERGGKPKMNWISKDWTMRFPKISGDTREVS